MTVYIVVRSDYLSDRIEKAYKDKEKAEQHARSISKPNNSVIGSVQAMEVEE